MRKPVLYCLLTSGLLAVLTVARASAQPEVADKEIDFIVDEELDLIESRIEPTDGVTAIGDNSTAPFEKTVEPSLTAAPPLELKTTTPRGIEISGEIAAVPDEDAAQAMETRIIPLVHAEASGVIAALEGMKSPSGEAAYDAAQGAIVLKDTAEKLAAMSEYVKRVDVPLATGVFKPEFVKTAEIIDLIRQQLTDGVGKAEPDEQADNISVTDTPETVGKIRELIKQVDRFNKAVSIETKILRIVLNEEHTQGVDWEAIVSDYQSIEVPGSPNGEPAASPTKLSLGAVTKEDYAVLLDALDTVGAITTVGEEAVTMEYDQHKTVKIPSVDQVGEGDASFIDRQVNLDVVPSYNSDGTQTVAVKPKSLTDHPRRLTGKENAAGTVIQVENEGTIVIGGRFAEVMVESTWKIPLLGDLPFLGFVFRNEGEIPRRAEVITFLTLKTVEKE